MGELRHAVRRTARAGLALGIVAVVLGCAAPDIDPSGPIPATDRPSSPTVATGEPAPSPDATIPSAVAAAEGRLVWTVDARGSAGIWTTDLAGGDARTLLAGLGDGGGPIRDAILVGDIVLFIRDSPAGSVLWAVREGAVPLFLLDAVEAFAVVSDVEVVAVRSPDGRRRAMRLRLGTGAVEIVGDLAADDPGAVDLGPYGVAVSPDGRTVAAGRVGGPIETVGVISGPAGVDIGAPLVVTNDGTVAASEGRAGEAYLVRDGALVPLAPPDSDPIVGPGGSIVAWGSVADDGTLTSVEAEDVISGAMRSYPAAGRATKVRWFTRTGILLEATAFDPLRRSVAFLDLGSGRFGTFEAGAPAGP